VRCDAAIKKCEWKGTIATLQEHAATCQLTLIPCPRECKEDGGKVREVMRKDLDHHLENNCPERNFQCEFCEEKSTYAHIKEIHQATCDFVILPCPSIGCPATMARQDIKKHVSDECQFRVVPCKYRRLGCNAELAKKDMPEHEMDNRLHLERAIDNAYSTKTKQLQAQSFSGYHHWHNSSSGVEITKC